MEPLKVHVSRALLESPWSEDDAVILGFIDSCPRRMHDSTECVLAQQQVCNSHSRAMAKTSLSVARSHIRQLDARFLSDPWSDCCRCCRSCSRSRETRSRVPCDQQAALLACPTGPALGNPCSDIRSSCTVKSSFRAYLGSSQRQIMAWKRPEKDSCL